jgi:hypothetical protein
VLAAPAADSESSADQVKDFIKLKEKLMALGQRLMGGDESCEAEYDK